MTPDEKKQPLRDAAPVAEKTPPRAKGDAKKRPHGRTASRKAALAGELTEALAGLRQNLRECAGHYLAANEAKLNRALARLQGNEAAGEESFVPPVKLSRALIDEIRELSLKPEKGRVKDLARLRQAIDRAARAIAENE